MSRARKVESRSSSSLMTTTARRRREATTRSLNRLLKELAEERRRPRKSNAIGLREPLLSFQRRRPKGSTHQRSKIESDDLPTMLVRISSSKTAEGS